MSASLKYLGAVAPARAKGKVRQMKFAKLSDLTSHPYTANLVHHMLPFECQPLQVSYEMEPVSFFSDEDIFRSATQVNFLPRCSATLFEEQQALTDALRSVISASAARAAVDARLYEINEIAKEEEITVSARSLACMRHFLTLITFRSAPKIFLQDAGTLRIAWRSASEQVALEFLDDGVIRYVFFANRPEPLHVARNAGIDDLEHILAQINTMGLAHLLNV